MGLVTWESLAALGAMDVLLIALFIPWVLLTRKDNPTSTLAWIMAIVILPFLGGLLFVIFGINRVERRKAGKAQATRAVEAHMPELSSYQLLPGEVPPGQPERLLRLATRAAGTVATAGNDVEVLPETSRTLELIEAAVLSARETLHLEYYIWQPDRTGTRLRDLLIQKARDGVQVRFLYDKIGSSALTQRFLKPMRRAGIHVSSFLPGPNWRERWSINLRSHRKIAVVDGRVGFTGGMNIGDEYLGKNRTLGYWRDTHLRLLGPTVLQLQQIFVEDWYYATGEELTGPGYFPPPVAGGNVAAQIVPSGPTGPVNAMHALIFSAINEARDRVLLTTSYFVPTPALVTALESAAYRGARVRILVPGRAAYQWTVWAARSYYDSLLRAGAEIYEYERGLMHAKTLTVDGQWSLVGTPNLDARSLLLNFEVAAVLYDARIASQLEEHFERDLAQSRRIPAGNWEGRPVGRRLVENVCRLFAPVL